MRPLARSLVAVTVVTLALGLVAFPALADPPVAGDDSYSTAEDQALSVPVGEGVLANDDDPDGTPVAQLVDDVANGTLALQPDGAFTYTPDQDFHGTDSFIYQAFDGPDGSGVATVSLTVEPVNDAPVAVDDSYPMPGDPALEEDGTLDVPAPGVLANDTDAEDDPLTAAIETPASEGEVTLNQDGSFSYLPGQDFDGTDSFTYRASDGSSASEPATVTLTVTPEEDPPVAVDDVATTDEDTPAQIDLIANDTDPDTGDALTVDISAAVPTHGTLQDDGGGTVTYTPAADYNGDDGFDYGIDDGHGGTDTAHVVVHVTAVDDAPVGGADSYTFANSALTVESADGVLANDTDVEGDLLHAVLDTAPALGSLDLHDDGSFTYTPDSTTCQRDDQFTYRAFDGTALSAPVTVVLHVRIPRVPATLTLARSIAVIPYHGSVTMTAQLSEFTPGVRITIVRQPLGGAPITVVTRAAESTGRLRYTVTGLAKKNTFTASSRLDNCHLAATSSPVVVQVRAQVTPALTGWYRIANGIRLFHQRTDPLFRATVAPAHPGADVKWIWQRKSGGAWRDYFTPTVGTDASAAGFFLKGTALDNTYRIRAVGPYGTDGHHLADNLPGSSRWLVFRITR